MNVTYSEMYQWCMYVKAHCHNVIIWMENCLVFSIVNGRWFHKITSYIKFDQRNGERENLFLLLYLMYNFMLFGEKQHKIRPYYPHFLFETWFLSTIYHPMNTSITSCVPKGYQSFHIIYHLVQMKYDTLSACVYTR